MTDRQAVDPQQLLDARLWVARLGESDVHGWWRSDGILGPDGAFVGPRVLPKTHATGRARIAVAVARHACQERHADPEVFHLFRLDSETEDRLDALLVEKLDDFEYWTALMQKLEALEKGAETATTLRQAGVVREEDLKYAKSCRFGPDTRSLPLESAESPAVTIRRLAAGFSCSQPGELAVPYAREL